VDERWGEVLRVLVISTKVVPATKREKFGRRTDRSRKRYFHQSHIELHHRGAPRSFLDTNTVSTRVCSKKVMMRSNPLAALFATSIHSTPRHFNKAPTFQLSTFWMSSATKPESTNNMEFSLNQFTGVSRSAVYDSIIQTIGQTPIIKLQRMSPKGVDVYVKLESENPGGSVKDRLALAVIEWGEKTGQLKSGQTVVEATSGNTGIGLAMVCAAKGYPLVCVMSESFSIERRKLMRFFGAKVVLTNPAHKVCSPFSPPLSPLSPFSLLLSSFTTCTCVACTACCNIVSWICCSNSSLEIGNWHGNQNQRIGR
jgi:hypothetical protein